MSERGEKKGGRKMVVKEMVKMEMEMRQRQETRDGGRRRERHTTERAKRQGPRTLVRMRLVRVG